jgi:hypothetical protein
MVIMTTSKQQPTTDPWINRMIVGSLSITLCTCVGGAIGLQVKNQPVPGLLTGMATGAMGSLTALVHSSLRQKEYKFIARSSEIDQG